MLAFRGQSFLEQRKPILLGFSIGNPHFYKNNYLEKLFSFSHAKSDLVKIIIPEVMEEHNLKALGSSKPSRRAHCYANTLRNKWKVIIKDVPATTANKFSFTDWMMEVEENDNYLTHLSHIRELFDKHQEFRTDVSEITTQVLRDRFKSRGGRQEEGMDGGFDVLEGVNYFLKELAFFMSIPSIYEGFDGYILVYPRENPPILEKFFTGVYDGINKPYFGYVMLN